MSTSLTDTDPITWLCYEYTFLVLFLIISLALRIRMELQIGRRNGIIMSLMQAACCTIATVVLFTS